MEGHSQFYNLQRSWSHCANQDLNGMEREYIDGNWGRGNWLFGTLCSHYLSLRKLQLNKRTFPHYTWITKAFPCFWDCFGISLRFYSALKVWNGERGIALGSDIQIFKSFFATYQPETKIQTHTEVVPKSSFFLWIRVPPKTDTSQPPVVITGIPSPEIIYSLKKGRVLFIECLCAHHSARHFHTFFKLSILR